MSRDDIGRRVDGFKPVSQSYTSLMIWQIGWTGSSLLVCDKKVQRMNIAYMRGHLPQLRGNLEEIMIISGLKNPT